MKISLQLYSVRAEVEKYGLETVLSAVKAAGFDSVEPAGYYDLGAEGLKKLLDKVGLSVTSAHISNKEITGNTEQVIKDMKTLGFTDAVIPWASAEMLNDDFDAFVEKVRVAQKTLEKNGMKLGYHNHSHEFENGNDYVKKLLDNVDGLFAEPDIFWLANAGKTPIEYVKSIENRLMAIHLKELSSGGVKEPNPVLGQGVSQTAQCIEFAVEKGIPYVVLEFEGLDMPYDEYLKKCADFIKQEVKKAEK